MDQAVRHQILALVLDARRRQEAQHPLDAEPVAETTAKIERSLDDSNTICLTQSGVDGAISGFLLARLVTAPPVYAPGGPVCLSLFAILPTGDPSLLRRAAAEGRQRGAVLLVINAEQSDQNKSLLLQDEGFTIASEWYRSALPLASGAAITSKTRIRAATAADVPQILTIGEQKRREYEQYQPVFWKKTDTPKEEFAPYLTSKVESDSTVALVSETTGGDIDGYILAEKGYVDDYAVASPDLWPLVGGALLREAAVQSKAKGVSGFLVVCGNQDIPKRTLLTSLEFDLVTNWYTLPI